MGQQREYNAQAAFRGRCDVLVVGGGIAGVAAAVAAKRAGARTILLEKTISLGGLATLGIVITYLPLCDGRGHQVIGGLGEELLLRSVAATEGLSISLRPEAIAVPECWTHPATAEERSAYRYRVDFNPASYMLDLEELLQNEGVELAYDSVFLDVSRNRTEVTGSFVVDKGGLGYYECGAVVDATGDADVCIAAGEDTVSRSANVRCGWFYYAQGQTVTTARMTEPYDRNPSVLPTGSEGFSCVDGASVTAQVLGSRDLMKKRLQELSAKGGGEASSAHPKAVPLILPQVPTFRMTRRLAGRVEPTAVDASRPTDDTIGKTGDWRTAGPVYHIPLGALRGAHDNLFAAGRNISVADDLWDATRAIPACAMSGQAAGCAAALVAQKTATASHQAPEESTHALRSDADLDSTALQSLLVSQGALLREEWR